MRIFFQGPINEEEYFFENNQKKFKYGTLFGTIIVQINY